MGSICQTFSAPQYMGLGSEDITHQLPQAPLLSCLRHFLISSQLAAQGLHLPLAAIVYSNFLVAGSLTSLNIPLVQRHGPPNPQTL